MEEIHNWLEEHQFMVEDSTVGAEYNVLNYKHVDLDMFVSINTLTKAVKIYMSDNDERLGVLYYGYPQPYQRKLILLFCTETYNKERIII